MTRASQARCERRRAAPLRKYRIPYVNGAMQRASREEAPRARETIRRFVDRVGWERIGLPMVCYEVVDGKSVPVMRRDWGRQIRKRDNLCFVAMPLGGAQGGGESRQVGAIFALVAVIGLAAFAGPAVAGLFATAGTSLFSIISGITAAVIVAGGSFLISHFLNNIIKGAQTTYTANISSNEARSQEPIPCHYGRLKFFPDLSASVYADYSGIDQIFHAIYCLGLGTYDVEEFGVGLTPVWTAAGGLRAGFTDFQWEFVPPGVDSVLFPTDVSSSVSVSGQQIPDAYGTFYPDGVGGGVHLVGPLGQTSGPNYIGPFIVNPSGTLATSVAVDLIWPGGCYNSNGNSASVEIICQYQYVDDSGTPLGSIATMFDKTYTFNNKTPVRLTESFTLPTPGRVQVKIGRYNGSSQGTNVDTVGWGALKAFLQGPNAVPLVTRFAVRIHADQQLSNYSSQQIYVIATRQLPVYNGSSFSTVATQNPVWAALDIWTNADYAAGQSINNVDLVTLYNYAVEADTRGDTFNYRFLQQTTVLNAIEIALKPMLSNPVYLFDKLSMIRDEQRTLPVLALTDFDIIRSSLSVSYTMQDQQTTDGVIVEYFEETNVAARRGAVVCRRRHAVLPVTRSGAWRNAPHPGDGARPLPLRLDDLPPADCHPAGRGRGQAAHPRCAGVGAERDTEHMGLGFSRRCRRSRQRHL